MQQLSQQAGMVAIGDAVAAGAAIDNESAVVDTQGWEGVVFFTKITDSVATGVATLRAEQSVQIDPATMTALVGAAAALTSAVLDDLNGKVLMVDVFRPRERYVMARRLSATANIAYGDVYAQLYGKKGKLPITDDASIGAKTVVASPSE